MNRVINSWNENTTNPEPTGYYDLIALVPSTYPLQYEFDNYEQAKP
ncbi:hypothetical protein [Snodgrassella alvi]|nr:hypothetical protein [Snodgrassella alvi]WLT03742.1 hypothetical protein RAM23_07980 [Snodgrassella alvi]